MNEKSISTLNQYDLVLGKYYRGRGSYLCETDRGFMILKEYHGSEKKLELVTKFLQAVKNDGAVLTDMPVRSKEGNFIVKDEEENSYILKRWFEGKECDPRNEAEVIKAMKALALLHKTGERGNKIFNEDEKPNSGCSSLLTSYEKHTRELKKIQSFIRSKQQKNEFESYFLEIIPKYLNKAIEITQILDKSNYNEELEYAIAKKTICHGEYMQHNILVGDFSIAVTNFEKMEINLPVSDVFLMLRKIMEKQGWNMITGNRMLEAYNNLRELDSNQREILKLRLIYPEKLWKLANHYYHNNKAWIPQKDIEKLRTFVRQTESRYNFAETLGK